MCSFVCIRSLNFCVHLPSWWYAKCKRFLFKHFCFLRQNWEIETICGSSLQCDLLLCICIAKTTVTIKLRSLPLSQLALLYLFRYHSWRLRFDPLTPFSLGTLSTLSHHAPILMFSFCLPYCGQLEMSACTQLWCLPLNHRRPTSGHCPKRNDSSCPSQYLLMWTLMNHLFYEVKLHNLVLLNDVTMVYGISTNSLWLHRRKWAF